MSVAPELLQLLKFVEDFSWIYDVQVTKLFTDQFWTKIPSKWQSFLSSCSYESLNQLMNSTKLESHHTCPEALLNFLDCCQDLSLPRSGQAMNQNISKVVDKTELRRWLETFTSTPECESVIERVGNWAKKVENVRGLSAKKLHEVESLCSIVDSVCQLSGSTCVLDVGSGLGYIGQTLSMKYSVLGLEQSEQRVVGANMKACTNAALQPKKDTKTFLSAQFSLSDTEVSFRELSRLLEDYKRMKLSTDTSGLDGISQNSWCSHARQQQSDADSESCMDQNLYAHSGSEKAQLVDETNVPRAAVEQTFFCMIGLHSCADLTPSAMKFFLRSDNCRSLVVLGCCYHNMTLRDDETFNNFPMSKALTEAISKSGLKMNKFGLRLAAQETRSRWQQQTVEDHEQHLKNVAYRAILEVFLDQEKLKMKKIHRHLAGKSAFVDFNTYIESISKTAHFNKDISKEYLHEKLSCLYDEYYPFFSLVEPFTFLQFLLQPVLETLIILDRLLYLRESGIKSFIMPVFDDRISPRNLAIIAFKDG